MNPNRNSPLLAASAALLLSGCAFAQTTPGVDVRPLSVTTSSVANTLMMGQTWGPQAEPSAARWVMNWANSAAVSPDGYVFGVTNYEEGQQKIGVYKDGDNLPSENSNIGAHSAVATRNYLVVGADDDKTIVVLKRLPGFGIDGKNGYGPGTRRDIKINDEADRFGVGLDERNDRLYAALARGVMKVFKFSDGSFIREFPIPLNATAMAVDGRGELWLSQDPPPEWGLQFDKLEGTFSGSQAVGKDVLENLTTKTTDDFFRTKAELPFVLLDLGAPKKVTRIHLQTDNSDSVGWKIEAANDPDGPWTEMNRIEFYLHEYPDEWLTVDDSKAYRYWRMSGNQSGLALRFFEAYAPRPTPVGKIVHYSPEGEKLPGEIPTVRYARLAWDEGNGRLLMSDNGPNQQIVGYKIVDGAPVIDTTFGVDGRFGLKGGVFAGTPAEMGAIGPLRFDNIRGLGADENGNIYLTMVGNNGSSQTCIEAYKPDGTPLWMMSGTSFEDQIVIDPADETNAYNGTNRYKMDFSQLAGNEWTYAGVTTNKSLFDDFRINNSSNTKRFLRIHGQPFLITGGDRQGRSGVFRFDRAKYGEVAVPVASFVPFGSQSLWPPHQPAGVYVTLWNDQNGDGQTQKEEFSREVGTWHLDADSFDDEGNLWFADPEAGRSIREFAVSEQLDQFGNPSWSWSSPRNRKFAMPAPFDGDKGRVGATQFDSQSNALFLVGFNAQSPPIAGLPGNTAFGRVLARYTIAGDKLNKTAQIELPYDVNIGAGARDQPYSLALAGDYIFLGYWNEQMVRVYRKDDLSFVGQYKPGNQTAHPILDGTANIRAYKRPGVNEYIISGANYVGNSIYFARWKPDVTRAPVTPSDFKVTPKNATSLGLSWSSSPDAVGYAVDRRDSSPSGWGKWHEIARVKGTTSFTDTGLDLRTYAYRVRAYNLGQGGGGSDYTTSIYAAPRAP